MQQKQPTEGPFFPPNSSAIIITKIASTALIDEVVKTVRSYFTLPISQYIEMDADSYRTLVAEAQDQLNKRYFTRLLTNDQLDLLMDVLATKHILIQRNLCLRATRPQIKNLQEFVGWHRESFYGIGVERCVNFWVPIANVNVENTLRYIPDSHLIPDDRLEIIRVEDASTPKHSSGHKIGLRYAPKNIISGVDFSQARPFQVKVGEAAIFSGALIHGAAENSSNLIRFSMDFRVIAKEAYGGPEIKPSDSSSFFSFVPL